MILPTPIQLIIGLGNPGTQYAETRHNCGFWFVDQLAQQEAVSFKVQSKFFSQMADISYADRKIYLSMPTTYMNESGRAVRSILQFYKIPLSSVFVVHDEIDFPAGKTRLKYAGGHGGHNGLRDIIQHCGENFWRLRIGVGHPGHKDLVHNYVLSKPPISDKKAILLNIEQALSVLPVLLNGDPDAAMRLLS